MTHHLTLQPGELTLYDLRTVWQHAGVVIVADGSEAADKRLARVLVNDCASGVMRHADAGYELAIEAAKRFGLKLPMIK